MATTDEEMIKAKATAARLRQAAGKCSTCRDGLSIDDEFKKLIPALTPEEYAGLEASILAEGCRDALVVWNGTIIDGHNRYEICQRHGIAFNTVEREFADREAAKDWIDANQLHRRNLTPDQRKILIGRRYNREKRQGERTDLTLDKICTKFPTASRLAEEYKTHPNTIKNYAKEAEYFERIQEEKPELATEIWSGNKGLIEARRQEKKEHVKKTEAPAGKYRVIYADPPWKYGDKLVEGYGAAENHYPTMSTKEICDLPIKELSEDNAVLFLWVTSPLLEECFEVIKAWGFKYKTSFVWDKVKHNMGHYNSVRHELLLICTRGSCLPDNAKLYDSVQTIEREEHSKKPDEFRAIIDTIYTHGGRIELFARQKAVGWAAWGNEL